MTVLEPRHIENAEAYYDERTARIVVVMGHQRFSLSIEAATPLQATLLGALAEGMRQDGPVLDEGGTP